MGLFRIAGGLFIFYTAFGMITRPESAGDPFREGVFEDISVYPLAIPPIAGPGCLTLSVLLFSRVRDGGASYLPLIVAIKTVFLVTYTCLLLSKRLARLVGQTVNSVLKRLLGVILASPAIQFLTDGVRGLWQ